MTWHQWHHTEDMERRMSLPRSSASTKASAPHSRHSISLARFGRGLKRKPLPLLLSSGLSRSLLLICVEFHHKKGTPPECPAAGDGTGGCSWLDEPGGCPGIQHPGGVKTF